MPKKRIVCFGFDCVEVNKMESFEVMSTAFANTESIPKKYTCQGEDISPPLQWDEVEEAKYYAVKIDDPDAPAGTWVHWIVINIPAEKTSIVEGEVPGEEVENDFGRVTYGGPCPPSGKHRYYFRVYALSDKLEGVTKENFEEKVKEHTLAYGDHMGTYEKE